MTHSNWDKRVGVQVKLRNPLRTRAIPERFCGGDSLRRGAPLYQVYVPLPFYLYQNVSNLDFVGAKDDGDGVQLDP